MLQNWERIDTIRFEIGQWLVTRFGWHTKPHENSENHCVYCIKQHNALSQFNASPISFVLILFGSHFGESFALTIKFSIVALIYVWIICFHPFVCRAFKILRFTLTNYIIYDFVRLCALSISLRSYRCNPNTCKRRNEQKKHMCKIVFF